MWDHKIGQLHCTLYTNISVLCAINSLGRKATVLESGYLEHLQEIYPEKHTRKHTHTNKV